MTRDPRWEKDIDAGLDSWSREKRIRTAFAIAVVLTWVLRAFDLALVGVGVGVLLQLLVRSDRTVRRRLAQDDPWLACLRALPASWKLQPEPTGKARGRSAGGRGLYLDQGFTEDADGGVGFVHQTRIALEGALPEGLRIGARGGEVTSGTGDRDFDELVFVGGPEAERVRLWLDAGARRALEDVVVNGGGGVMDGWIRTTLPEAILDPAALQERVARLEALYALLERAVGATDEAHLEQLTERVLHDPVAEVRARALKALAALCRSRGTALPEPVRGLQTRGPLAMRLPIWAEEPEPEAAARLSRVLRGVGSAECDRYFQAPKALNRVREVLRSQTVELDPVAARVRWAGAESFLLAWWRADSGDRSWLQPLLLEVGGADTLALWEGEDHRSTEPARDRLRARLGRPVAGGLSVIEQPAAGGLAVVEPAIGGVSVLDREPVPPAGSARVVALDRGAQSGLRLAVEEAAVAADEAGEGEGHQALEVGLQ